jgi:hypothetical protein
MRLIRCLLAGLLLGSALGILSGLFVGFAMANMAVPERGARWTRVATSAGMAWALLGLTGGLLVGFITWLTGRKARRQRPASAPEVAKERRLP